MVFENPCEDPVEFVFQIVEGVDDSPIGFPNPVRVPAGEAITVTELTIAVRGGAELLVTVDGLNDYFERWPEPRTSEERSFAFDRSLCDVINR